MELSVLSFLIVCPAVFLAGFVDSIAGGGGLIAIPAYLLAGVPGHLAIGTNKLSSVFGTATSTIRFWKNGMIRRWMLYLVPAALIGSTAGAKLSLLVSEKVLGWIMVAVLPVVAFIVLRNHDFGDFPDMEKPGRREFAAAMLSSFLIGGYDGFYGPGAGTFMILALTGAAKLSLRQAEGACKVMNLSSNAAALVTFLLSGTVVIPLGLAAAAANAAGQYIGSGMVVSNGKNIVRPVIIGVLVLLFLKLLTEL